MLTKQGKQTKHSAEAHKKHGKEKYGKYLQKYKAHMGDFLYIVQHSTAM